jgi:RNA polymerase-interacting CarD/CdnL/TRCF family regulator
MGIEELQAGDRVYHPRYGFGVVENLVQRHSVAVVLDGVLSQLEEYYEIMLQEGGSLLVPAARANDLGLRRLTNGLSVIEGCLRSQAEGLPEKTRDRVSALRARSQDPEPTALPHAVRDLVAQSHGRELTASEKSWLDKACERLITEVALVDEISTSEARVAIERLLNGLAD